MAEVTKKAMKRIIDNQVDYLQGERKKNALLAQKVLHRYPSELIDLHRLHKLIKEELAHKDTIKDAYKMLRVVYTMLEYGQKHDQETEDFLNTVRSQRKPLAETVKKSIRNI